MLKHDNFKPATKFAQIRRHWPQIKLLLAEGVLQEDILKALHEEGLDISVSVFRVYVYRFRKQEATQPVDNKINRSTAVLPPGTGGVTPSQKPNFQTNTLQTMSALTDTNSKRESPKAVGARYVPEEGYPLPRRNKGA